jgi:NADPH:quinone reductase-like Zn-dependent oxidoreductase
MRAWAVVENGKPLQELELPTPEPKGTEVLVEVTHCGVCHSDLHIWEGYYDLGGGKHMSLRTAASCCRWRWDTRSSAAWRSSGRMRRA